MLISQELKKKGETKRGGCGVEGFGSGVCMCVVAAGVKRWKTAMASIAAGFRISLWRLLRSRDRLALMATAGIIFLCRQIMNCAGVRVLLGLAGHDSVRVSILFFYFCCCGYWLPGV